MAACALDFLKTNALTTVSLATKALAMTLKSALLLTLPLTLVKDILCFGKIQVSGSYSK